VGRSTQSCSAAITATRRFISAMASVLGDCGSSVLGVIVASAVTRGVERALREDSRSL
jgi:hypothetical protein